VLAERFAMIVNTQPELVAHHYTEAGLTEQAIRHFQYLLRSSLARSVL
jgi:hypothetical protein